MPTLPTRQKIRSELSQRRLEFNPSGEPACFTVTVYNESDRFAAFRLTLKAPGIEDSRGAEWYRLVPSVSSKIPSGDVTKFDVEIFAPPPTEAGFTGSMSLQTVVSSIDLDRQEDRQDLKLQIEGGSPKASRLELKTPSPLEVLPVEIVKLTVEIENRNHQLQSTTLEIDPAYSPWFENNGRRVINLEPNVPKTITFQGRIPESQACGLIQVEITATQPNIPRASVTAALQVLPTGNALFRAEPLEAQIPERAYRWLNPTVATTTYSLTLDNRSNQSIGGDIKVYNPNTKRWEWPWTGYKLPWQWPWEKPAAVSDDLDQESIDDGSIDQIGLDPTPGVEIIPESPSAGINETQVFSLEVTRRLPWLGWPRREQLEAHMVLVEGDCEVQDDVQLLDLGILPVIPFKLQLLALILIPLIIAAILRLFPSNHTEPVNSVQFNGLGTEVMSGSNDQTIRRWSINGDRLTPKGIVLKEAKAIRRVKFRPVNNDEIAVGLENGEIRVASLLQRNDLRSGALDNADRVFDLTFSQDSRSLFSAHGSGQVAEWDITSRGGNRLEIAEQFQIKQPFAISTMVLLGDQEELIAMGGRYNRLNVIDRNKKQYFDLAYNPGGQEDYIKSFATAEQQPYLLASSDNQGNIALWDFTSCKNSLQTCQALSTWTGHGGKTVNAVKLTGDGCFLASAGGNGEVKLWALDGKGNLQKAEGKVLGKYGKPLNTVDVIRKQDSVLVVTGGDDHQVRLHQVKLTGGRSSGQCNAQIN
jgi:WD40 repeat protein